MNGFTISDFSRLCVHTITTRPWPIERAIDSYAAAGVKGITVWRDALEERNPAVVGERIRSAGLDAVALCRGGFFPANSAESREKALEDNRLAIEQAAALGAPQVVLVCGAVPGMPLEEGRAQTQAGIEAILPQAEAANIKLSIEPLHPMYADCRSTVNTMRQANDMAEAIDSPLVGVAVDVYHLWWDPDLQSEIARCGAMGKLFAFHVCDWKTPTDDMLWDRGLMGEGCIPLKEIRAWVEEAGFSGYNEVEIFSEKYWKEDQSEYLDKITKAYLERV